MDTTQIIILASVAAVLILILVILFAVRHKLNKKINKTQISASEPAKVTPSTAQKEIKKEQKATNNYHISENKDAKSPHYKEWRVRKQSSQKTIKYFKTQKEAISFAESLADNNDGNTVIHKKKGTIRKQNY